MDYSLQSINLRAEGGNSDMWQVVQVRYTELVHNWVIVGDWT